MLGQGSINSDFYIIEELTRSLYPPGLKNALVFVLCSIRLILRDMNVQSLFAF